ncbi:DegT/DnrJ/EryC1/StrS family aminotransferase [Methanolobus sediminis]|uniref:DegT/DnrJ/EryC1/StrS family aminotransferase n=1 Tax=Methanolobus sediminis TaxID=3072978 RepID=A0AA51YM00_9EURY|nr:DegT/DnrJ/EryC1/StrS family aminotransferase [Methanolobus sediminis]WMW25437.1 DegT/DnrJ/EryC1/StrS family aminotransferase [Methanolobus sediminis]
MGIKLNPGLIPRFNIDYGLKDLFYALLNLWKTPDVSLIKGIFEDSDIYWTNSGRTSLYTILKALDLPEKARIGISLYTCPSDFDAIIQAGHVPVFLDIDLENLTVSTVDLAQKIDVLDAVVVVHIFGRPAEMDEILQICGDKPIIEDCAHSLLSTYKGNLTGTMGIAGFFSFRSGKYISAGEGGLIVTKEKELAEKIKSEVESYDTSSSLDEILHTFISFIRSFLYHRPWFGLFSFPFGSLIEKKVDVMNKYSFKKRRIRNSNLHVILKKMRGFRKVVDATRVNSYYLMDRMASLELKLPCEKPDSWCNYFLFPILFKDTCTRDKTAILLFENGIDNAKMFTKTPEIAKREYGYQGDCANTEFVSERILVVPHYHTLKETELDKIVKVIENAGNK